MNTLPRGRWALQLLNEVTGQFETEMEKLRLSQARVQLDSHDCTRRLMRDGQVMLTISKFGTPADFADDPERLF